MPPQAPEEIKGDRDIALWRDLFRLFENGLSGKERDVARIRENYLGDVKRRWAHRARRYKIIAASVVAHLSNELDRILLGDS